MPDLAHHAPDSRITFLVGDLTEQAVDAIVNAAKHSLLGGGGVDGAIHRRGGPAILEACREIRRTRWPDGLPVGEAVATAAGNLPARYVIHTVGPIYGQHDGAESELLAACYRNALLLAERMDLTSIAFPAISTGVYGYPPERAAPVVTRALHDALAIAQRIREVRLVFFNHTAMETFLTYGNIRV
jgi:O-acetyl-ADP-ribose deacetylase (regulator of RNase III)